MDKELVKMLRVCGDSNNSCVNCPIRENDGGCPHGEWEFAVEKYMLQAADAIEELNHIVQTYAEKVHKLEEKHRWIPVTERLPKEGVPVFVRFCPGESIIDQTVCEWFIDDRNQIYWKYWLGGGVCSVAPTHWKEIDL